MSAPPLTLRKDRLIGNRILSGSILAGSNTGDSDSGHSRGGVVSLENESLDAVSIQFRSNFAQAETQGFVHDADGGALHLAAESTA
jgi:hypothetical protein